MKTHRVPSWKPMVSRVEFFNLVNQLHGILQKLKNQAHCQEFQWLTLQLDRKKNLYMIRFLGWLSWDTLDLHWTCFGAGKLVMGEDKTKYNQQLKDDRQIISDRAQAALKTLQNMDQVQRDNIAAIGYCLGGKVVMDLARTNAEGLKGVVSYHGILDKYIPSEPTYFNARVLAFHGSKDPYISPEMLTGFISEMEERKVDCDVVQFVNCVHSFTRPDKKSEEDLIKFAQQYSERADKRSWEQTVVFLNEIFG
eukprot:TRINITY_DN24109_c0_g1_i2.p1 TRINITY_DN24109_c0_g1~~TRINITY_DN24109_c0_g1_i2.p1  ORF type:complete len:252 (+),score=36.17 TRINITY_DN24109_c0_g1_i2:2-757(+)